MKKIFILLTALAIAPLMVVVSCVSTQAHSDGSLDRINLNTGPDKDGKIFSVQVIDRLERVIVLDMTDRGKRMELATKDWSYDPLTTRLTVTRAIPYVNPVYHLEGQGERPARFILWNVKKGEAPIVFVGKRVAIEGVDYDWDSGKSLLTVRKAIDPEKPEFFVDYITDDGGACFGDMGDAENADRIEYYLAEKRRGDFKKTVESGAEFPFLEKRGSGDPVVVMRKPTAQEKLDLVSQSVPVIKCRSKSDAEISKEVGFDARMPGKIRFAGSSAFADPGVKMILETAGEGTSALSVMCYYQLSDKVQSQADDSIPLTLSREPRAETAQESDFRIESSPMAKAPQVTRSVYWSIRQDERGYGVTKSVSYRGMSRGVDFEVSCSTDPETCARAEELILAFLKLRS
jgi:hypothetical protein